MKENDKLAQVRCFLLDMDGTFYLGERLIEGALEFIDVLHQQGREFLFLTNNSSKDSGQYAEKITRLGLSIPREKVMTSGEATTMHIQSQRPGARVYVVGTPALENEFIESGFVLTHEMPDFAVLGFDTTLTYAKLWKLCDLVRAGMPYIATHPDYNCPTETGFMPDIGAMIAFVKAATGREPDLVVGKPNRIFIEKAAERVGIPVSAMCMIGDRLYTDIAIGETAGIATILVLSGETRAEEVPMSAYQPSYMFQNLGAVADYLSSVDFAK
ncbi:MAG: HAD-IIA family hydrolase [Anaerolineae bacterium]|nr:HAD-IIA family hydrolase [Anaerolineae bacterium]MCI0608282.1 HAD-IIA family hydrolase [Anaerolineae bacterium]